MALEIDRTLVCSTSHLTQEDSQALFNESTDLVVYIMDEYGWMILARPLEKEQGEQNHSDNLEKLLEFARKNDCDWIRFDCDADEIEGMDTFEW